LYLPGVAVCLEAFCCGSEEVEAEERRRDVEEAEEV
jgi:hypothetical protein